MAGNNRCRPKRKDRLPWSTACTFEACRCSPTDLPAEPWKNPKYVGVGVATESAEEYYRRLHPVINNLQLQELADFLENGHFHLGVAPKDYLQKLYLRLYEPSIYTPDRKHQRRVPAPGETDYGAEYLGQLLGLEKKAGLRLTVCASWLHFISPSSDAWARALAPIAKALRGEGANIAILVWDAHGEYAYDITEFLDLEQIHWGEAWDERTRDARWRQEKAPCLFIRTTKELLLARSYIGLFAS